MYKKLSGKNTFLICTALWLALCVSSVNAAQFETAEIVFLPTTTTDAQALADQSARLGNAVAIYEYVHNNFEYKPYHGSRSGSINTFMGQIGSDVDISTAMIAMLRSQNIPARYAVGTVKIPAAQLNNWLNVSNIAVAVQVLQSQGIQGVTLAADSSYVTFEHTWTEALIPFDQYRGVPTPTTVDCSLAANASRCNWVPLDGSFKQKIYNGLNLDPYTALSFDYTGYYQAILNNDATRLDKNPLTILEDQVQTWLRTSNPGNSLDDVADAGQIIPVHDGLLPASLPYTLVGTPRHYDSVALHDAAVAYPTTASQPEPKKWGKTLSISIALTATLSGGGTLNINVGGGSGILLAQLNTQRLTQTTEFPAPGNIPNMVTRLGGVEIARPLFSGTIVGYTPAIGQPYTLTVSMDGTPDPTGGTNDRTITATYNAAIGGYYLIATGGESSNWSQVHRAANQLLTDNQNYKIVLNPAESGCTIANGQGCTPYVDLAGTGVYAATDPALLTYKPALDALTGGLLYVAATQYYANQREMIDRADHLMKTKTPIIGFLGVVSSTYQAEYINGTAFSIMPGGLLIDIKGNTIGGSYRMADNSYSNSEFELIGHISSALEHETWQELTGYDAVSTVRGIQMALAGGSSLVNVQKNSTTDNVSAFVTASGFGASAPSPFTLTQRSIFGSQPVSWSTPTVTLTQSFDVLELDPSGSTDPHNTLWTYYDDYWDTKLACYYNNQNTLNNLVATYGGLAPLNAGGACDASWGAGTTLNTALTLLSNAYSNYRSTYASKFNFFDAGQGFVSTKFGYRSTALAANAYSSATIGTIRNILTFQDNTKLWLSYTLPSTLVTAPFNHFQVDIRRLYDAPTGRLNSMAFEILNTGP